MTSLLGSEQHSSISDSSLSMWRPSRQSSQTRVSKRNTRGSGSRLGNVAVRMCRSGGCMRPQALTNTSISRSMESAPASCTNTAPGNSECDCNRGNWTSNTRANSQAHWTRRGSAPRVLASMVYSWRSPHNKANTLSRSASTLWLHWLLNRSARPWKGCTQEVKGNKISKIYTTYDVWDITLTV